METQQEAMKRAAVKEAYSGSTTWAERVDKMSTKQVAAIYIKLKSQGRVA